MSTGSDRRGRPPDERRRSLSASAADARSRAARDESPDSLDVGLVGSGLGRRPDTLPGPPRSASVGASRIRGNDERRGRAGRSGARASASVAPRRSAAARPPAPPPSAPLVSPAVRLRLLLLAVGLGGAAAVVLAMRYTAHSAAVAGRLGMARVEGNFDAIVGILAVPALLFFVILVVWSVVDLVRFYRAANDPERFGRARRSGRGRSR